MKRRIEESVAKVEGLPQHQIQRSPHTGTSVVQTSFGTSQSLKGASTGEVGSLQQQYPIQSYVTMPSITTSIKPQTSVLPVSGTASGPGILVQQPHIRQNKVTTPGSGPPNSSSGGTTVGTGNNQQQFQRLKVEDALSYLDQVKYKFNNQPQVYNDFLEIMKEFKSQCIDTPGVITRVSNLFKGYPELISGFNTFLPPGYKIEVQANDTGYSLQVSVSNPLGHHTMTEIPPLTPTQPPSVVVTNQQSKVPPAVYGTTPGLIPNSSKPLPERGASGGASALQVLGSSNLPPSQPTNHQSTTNQPVEFNHAINYVNKIKNRFQGQPDKYKKFLEILHTYQKEQRNVKETSGNAAGGGKHLTEAEVYSQVAQLFENHDDLLAEFGQFLPDATSHNSLSLANLGNKISDRVKSNQGGKYHHHHHHTSSNTGSTTNNKNSPPSTKPSLGIGGKRSATELYSPSVPPLTTTASTIKRPKLQSSAAPGSNANIPSLANHTYSEQFLQLKKCLRSTGAYESVLKCVYLYNCEVISRSELIILLTPLLLKHPEHLAWLKDTLGVTGDVLASPVSPTLSDPPTIAPPLHLAPSESTTSDIVDFTTCKKIGASYCALPKGRAPPRCSGRTQLCRQVLNDTWVSFPTWSEEATFVTSRKTQYEEYIYRCEDERFELDLVIECNAATIKVLDGVQRKMSRMTQEELAKFRLDDTLGGTSATIHLKALKRIYGEKSGDIVEGLKKNPSVAVPVVLRRLKAKEMEWRQAQKGFNKVWREQNEKYYLKSLDHQGINFKQNDLKALRSKPLYNEIETAYDERQERDENKVGPHMVLNYPDKSALDDAANLLIHHVKRQTAIHKSDKTRIKQLLRHYLPDMFHHRRQDLSDDELDSDEKVDVDAGSRGTSPNNIKKEANGPTTKKDDIKVEVKLEKKEDEDLPGAQMDTNDSDDEYTLFYGNNHWYLFLRLHHILCERLAKMAERSAKIADEENANSQFRKESTAVALRLKPNEHCSDCYGTMLEMVKSVLDCSMDPSTYEDTLRNMFGIHAYIGFTLDRIVSYAVRQVQSLVTEDVCCEMWDTFQKMKSQGGAGGKLSTAESRAQDEALYHKQALASLPDSALDNFYKIYIYKKDCKVTIELMDTEGEEEDTKPTEEGKWSQHDDGPVLSAEDRERWGKAVFLKRNVKDWERKNKEKQRLKEKEKSNSGENNKLADHDGKCLLQDEDMVIFSYKDRLLYKSKALTRARLSHNRVSRRMLERVQRWHERWARENVSPPTEERSRAWFLGKVDGIRPGLVTTSRSDNSLSRPPYRPYNRYSVLASIFLPRFLGAGDN